jgi:oxygen-dependent protoporphyrinogen oxidase
VQVHSHVTVCGLERRPGGGWRLLTGPVPASLRGTRLEADAVVLAVPARPASRLLAGVCPAGAAELADIEAASVGLVAAVVERPVLAGLPGSGVLVPPIEGRGVKAMTFSSAKWAWVGALDPRFAVVRLSLGRHREEAVLQRDDDELTAMALADAAGLLGRPLTPVATRVVRWGGSLPQPAVGHTGRIARLRSAVAALPGLAVCGAALDGVGIPACIAAATAAAATIAAGLRAPPGAPDRVGAAAAEGRECPHDRAQPGGAPAGAGDQSDHPLHHVVGVRGHRPAR